MNQPSDPRWKFIAGELCLDFVNTVVARGEQRIKDSILYTFRTDKLGGYTDLAEWSKDAEILKEGELKQLIRTSTKDVNDARRVFSRAITLRESLFRIFKHLLDRRDPPNTDIELLKRECNSARNRQEFVYASKKFAWTSNMVEGDLCCMIWPIALSASQLLSSDQLQLVKQCPSPDCGWLFVDSSKNRSRQWCDMRDCGNLAKVRRYRERQKK